MQNDTYHYSPINIVSAIPRFSNQNARILILLALIPEELMMEILTYYSIIKQASATILYAHIFVSRYGILAHERFEL